MKYKRFITRIIPRTAAFWLAGLMNTVFLKPEDIGMWKNYVGYFLLILALIETIFLITILLKINNYEKVKDYFFKVLALFIPFYFVYFPQLHEDSANPEVKSLWKYVLIGFLIYVVFLALYSLSVEHGLKI